jgi:hypothetical protein
MWAASLISLAVGLLVACGGSPVTGNGEVVTETRTVSSFDAVSVNNGARVILTVGALDAGDVDLAVTTDSNLLKFVTTEVRGGTLKVSIDGDGGVSSSQGSEVSSTVAALRDISVNNGASAEVVGAVSDLTLSANNGALFDGEGLEAATVSVDVDNGALVAVCATGSVSGQVTNGAGLTVTCGGDVTDIDTSDGGSVSSAP